MKKKKFGIFLLGIACVLVVGLPIFFFATPTGKSLVNRYDYVMEKVDEKTYANMKEVEDTCRSYIASYKADKMAYYQYRDSESELEKSWASGYKARANATATTYNEYFLKNNYVWKDNIPSDIVSELPYITD